jgi:hypothetical protein
MLEWTHEDLVDTKTSVGGVIGILRTLKVECLTSLTCLALRESDGTFSIATFPVGGAVPPWSLERIERVLEEIWADPTLESGNVMIRASRRTNGNSAGPQLRIASAALRWSDDSASPWGLVCLLDPLSGNFDQDQCDHLARAAARIVGYFEARHQVLDEQPEETRASTTRIDHRAERSIREPIAGADLFDVTPRIETPPRRVSAKGSERSVTSNPVKSKKSKGTKKAKGKDKLQGKKADRKLEKKAAKKARSAKQDRSNTALLQRELADDTRKSELRLDVDDLITMRAPSETERPGRPERVVTTRPHDDGYDSLEARSSYENTPIQGLLGALEVDPVTGLGGLPSLFGELGIALSAPRSESGCVVLTLLCFVPTRPVKTKLVNQVAVELGQTLRNHVRGDDAVFRIAESVFAVVTTLRSHAVFPANIQDRLNQALRFALASSQAPFEIRSSLVSTSDYEGGIGPELFFRSAMLDLEL